MIELITKVYMNFVTILSGFLTPLIAIIAIYIAYQQHLTNKHRLRLALYEKRFRIFEETKKILLKIAQDSKIDLTEIRDFKYSVNESKFLFDNEIYNYVEDIRKNANKWNHITNKLKDNSSYPVGSLEIEKIKQKDESLNNWFTYEYQNIENRFAKYLDFKTI